jgi:hypothetical protein
MARRLEIIALLILLIAILVPRLPAIDVFTTVDESTWLMRSANFYYALSQRDFEKTVYAYHPAVTTMWTGTLAIAMDFPEYRGFGQGYFVKEWKFSEFLQEYGYDPLQMLKTSRLITVGINAGLLLVIYYLIRRLFDWFSAFISVFLLSFEPFLLGHTRILAHEGMMSLLLLVSILAFLNYVWKDDRWIFLVSSGIAAALALLTKSSATIILLFVGLLCLIDLARSVKKRKGDFQPAVWKQVKRFGGIGFVWLATLILFFTILWPGMWVNPGKMLYEMYGNAFSYAFEGHNLEVQDEAEDASVEEPTTVAPNIGYQKFMRNILWRTTPITWAGIILFLILLLRPKILLPDNSRQTMLTLFGFGFLFYMMMSIAKGRQAAHYIMATYASWSLVSGLAIAFVISYIQNRFSEGRKRIVPFLTTAGVLAFQAIFAFNYSPYYLNFSNPIMEALQEGPQTAVSGFGEGLELAAEYLAEKPNADKLTVMSWYGIGPFSFYFPGQTENLYPSGMWSPGLISRLEKSDYLVIYYSHQIGRNMPAKLMHEIKGLEPDHSIWINGVEYIRIFKVSELPQTLWIPDPVETP